MSVPLKFSLAYEQMLHDPYRTTGYKSSYMYTGCYPNILFTPAGPRGSERSSSVSQEKKKALAPSTSGAQEKSRQALGQLFVSDTAGGKLQRPNPDLTKRHKADQSECAVPYMMQSSVPFGCGGKTGSDAWFSGLVSTLANVRRAKEEVRAAEKAERKEDDKKDISFLRAALAEATPAATANDHPPAAPAVADIRITDATTTGLRKKDKEEEDEEEEDGGGRHLEDHATGRGSLSSVVPQRSLIAAAVASEAQERQHSPPPALQPRTAEKAPDVAATAVRTAAAESEGEAGVGTQVRSADLEVGRNANDAEFRLSAVVDQLYEKIRLNAVKVVCLDDLQQQLVQSIGQHPVTGQQTGNGSTSRAGGELHNKEELALYLYTLKRHLGELRARVETHQRQTEAVEREVFKREKKKDKKQKKIKVEVVRAYELEPQPYMRPPRQPPSPKKKKGAAANDSYSTAWSSSVHADTKEEKRRQKKKEAKAKKGARRRRESSLTYSSIDDTSDETIEDESSITRDTESVESITSSSSRNISDSDWSSLSHSRDSRKAGRAASASSASLSTSPLTSRSGSDSDDDNDSSSSSSDARRTMKKKQPQKVNPHAGRSAQTRTHTHRRLSPSSTTSTSTTSRSSSSAAHAATPKTPITTPSGSDVDTPVSERASASAAAAARVHEGKQSSTDSDTSSAQMFWQRRLNAVKLRDAQRAEEEEKEETRRQSAVSTVDDTDSTSLSASRKKSGSGGNSGSTSATSTATSSTKGSVSQRSSPTPSASLSSSISKSASSSSSVSTTDS